MSVQDIPESWSLALDAANQALTRLGWERPLRFLRGITPQKIIEKGYQERTVFLVFWREGNPSDSVVAGVELRHLADHWAIASVFVREGRNMRVSKAFRFVNGEVYSEY